MFKQRPTASSTVPYFSNPSRKVASVVCHARPLYLILMSEREDRACPERTRDDGQTRQRVWTLSIFFFFFASGRDEYFLGNQRLDRRQKWKTKDERRRRSQFKSKKRLQERQKEPPLTKGECPLILLN